MPKVRVSHFVAKNIPITPENSSSCEPQSVSTQEHDIQSSRSPDNKPEKQAARISIRRREIIATSQEAKYASVPKKQYSKRIEEEIFKEAALFRYVSKN